MLMSKGATAFKEKGGIKKREKKGGLACCSHLSLHQSGDGVARNRTIGFAALPSAKKEGGEEREI